MNPLSFEALSSYWADPEVGASLVVLMNLLGALALGALVGYERTYRSRAAGMRTLGLVCMASAALTVLCGYPHLWFGGQFGANASADPTRVIQGIVTGVGFLGAGVILKDGTQISGLTTAATIWVVSAVGVLVGVGLYPAAILMAFASAGFTMWGSTFEVRLPAQTAVVVSLKFDPTMMAKEEELRAFLFDHGYLLAGNTISIVRGGENLTEWRFVAVGSDKRRCSNIPALAREIGVLSGLKDFQLSYARN